MKNIKFNSICMLDCKQCQLSEKAPEPVDKEYKQFRRFLTRKNLRINCKTDLLHMILVSTDPYISSARKKSRRPFRRNQRNFNNWPRN